MSRYVPVKGHSGLVRDMKTNALINTNAEEIEQARERKRLRKLEKAQKQSLEQKVETIEKDLDEIKSMLNHLIHNSYK
jgi:hypothetical protein